MKYNSKTWTPTGEDGSPNFDKRFPIDRTYQFYSIFRKYRIRFVQYPDCGKERVRVFITSLFRMPKWYFRHIEKTMKPILPNWLMVRSHEYLMTHGEVLEKFGYSI